MILKGKGAGLSNAGGGTIELTDDCAVISKKNLDTSGAESMLDVLLTTSTKGQNSIPYSAIMAINISKGGLFDKPFIQILSAGEKSISGSSEAMSSPSCLLFSKKDLPSFEELKVEIEKRSKQAKQASNSSATSSIADELKKLSELREAGVITREEFDQQKEKLLAA